MFQKKYPGRRIQFTDVAELFGSAYSKACTIENAISGFRKCGICPYNAEIFSDEDFAPSSVTDRPNPNDHPEHVELYQPQDPDVIMDEVHNLDVAVGRPLDVNPTIAQPIDVNVTAAQPQDVTVAQPQDVSPTIAQPIDVNVAVVQPQDLTVAQPQDVIQPFLIP